MTGSGGRKRKSVLTLADVLCPELEGKKLELVLHYFCYLLQAPKPYIALTFLGEVWEM